MQWSQNSSEPPSRSSSMPLNQVSSERIACLRFPLIVGIIFIHGYSATVAFSDKTRGVAEAHWFSVFIRDLISQHLARIAVPLFFFLSGYLFFLGMEWSWHQYGRKLASRFRSLCIPFFFWNVLTLALLALAQALPALSSYFPEKGGVISDYSLYDYLNALLGIERFPVAYQFWFIRDLMVMVLLVPPLVVFLKFLPRLALFVFAFLWFYPFWPLSIPCSTAFFFFYSGAVIAISLNDLFFIDIVGKWTVLLYFVVLAGDLLLVNTVYHGYVHRVELVLGVASVLYGTRFVVEKARVKFFLLRSAGWSFFVFAVHEPLLTMTRKTTYYFLQPTSDVLVLLLYFLVPAFVVLAALAGFNVLKMMMPRFLAWIIGGRNDSRTGT